MFDFIFNWAPYVAIVVVSFFIGLVVFTIYRIKSDTKIKNDKLRIMGNGIYFRHESGTAPAFDGDLYKYKFVTGREMACKLAQVKIPDKSPTTGKLLTDEHRVGLKRMLWNKAKEMRRK